MSLSTHFAPFRRTLPRTNRLKTWAIAVTTTFLMVEAPEMAHGQAINASVQSVTPPKLLLNWDAVDYGGTPVERLIYRRNKGGASWGTLIADLPDNPGTLLTYVDSTVTAGVPYEYKIETHLPTYSNSLYGYGTVSGGINVPSPDSRGKLLLLVDASQSAALAPELTQLQQDLAGDGWTVLRSNLPRATVDAEDTNSADYGTRLTEVTNVKSVIQNAYNADPTNVKAVYIVGHIPVPYSGDVYPDGHFPQHAGSWPADTYYADVSGSVWTDSSVNVTSADDPRQWNVPGDGKFDPGYIPASLILQVGRVDFRNMTVFPNNTVPETELLRRYLHKEHDYRYRQGAYANIDRRAIVFDTFGDWLKQDTLNSMASFNEYSIRGVVGRDPSFTDFPTAAAGDPAPWLTWMESNPSKTYLVGYASSAGASTANIAGGSSDFGSRPSRAVFNDFFGSFLGDWGYDNDLMRATLAGNATGDSLGLTCFWGGRPTFVMDSMALGETVGYATLVSQNNDGTLYNPGDFGARGIHTALMGDPTLRFYTVLPPQNLQATSSSGAVTLNWTASTESNLLGYLVYRGASAAGPFTKLTTSPISATTYTDSSGSSGTTYTYMVRTLKLETTPAGTFQNPSGGVFATLADSSAVASIPQAPSGLQVSATNSTTINLTWTDNGTGATGYLVERRNSPTASYSLLATLPSTATSYVDSGPLTVGTTFYYQVIATGNAGNSLPSSEVYLNGYAGFLKFTNMIVHVTRSGSTVSVPVLRVGGSTGTATVSYTTTYNTADDTALPNVDYTPISGTLTFADGETQKNITVTLLKNSPQPPVSFTMTLTNPTGASLITQGFVGGTTTQVLLIDPNAPLQSPWLQALLGGPALDPGAYGQVGSDLTSEYYGGFWNNNDAEAGNFIYQPLSGDSVMTAKVTGPGDDSIALMVRQDVTNPFCLMSCIRLTDLGTGSKFFVRTNDTADPYTTLTGLPVATSFTGTSYYVRLTRSGSQFTGEISPDGTTWTELGSATVVGMPANANWGFFQETNMFVGIQSAQLTHIAFSSVAAPAAPTTLAATRGAASVNLAWTDNSSNESGFSVERRVSGSGTFAVIGTAPADTPSYADATAAGSTSYDYRVRAFNNTGNSNYSNTATVGSLSPPPAPTALSAVRTTSAINLSWTDNGSASSESGFSIQRRVSGSGAFSALTTVAQGTATYADSAADIHTAYDYEVCSTNGAGNSPFSNIASAGVLQPPAAPINFTVTQNGETFVLTWSDDSNGLASGFTIEREVEGTNVWVTLTNFGSGTVDSTVSPDTGYQYRVSAYNAAGNSADTTPVSVATAPVTTKTITTADGQGAEGQISSANPTANYAGATSITFAADTSTETDGYVRFDLSSLPAGTTFTNVAFSVTTSGALSGDSDQYFCVFYLLPDPDDVWNASTLTWNNAPIKGSAVKSTTFACYLAEYPASAIAPGTSITTLQGSSLLTALNSSAAVGTNGLITLYSMTFPTGTGLFATHLNTAFAPPTLVLTYIPPTPIKATNLTASLVSPGTVAFQWTDNATNATGYQIQASTDGGATYATIATAGATATSLITSAIPPSNGTQLYRVVAFNGAGNATPSLTASLNITLPNIAQATDTPLLPDWAKFAFVILLLGACWRGFIPSRQASSN